MLTVRLHGHLEEKYGSEFKFAASTVREVIDALQANFPDFTEEFIKDERAYNILVDAEAQEIAGCVMPIKSDSVIDIIPVIGGAGFLKGIGLVVIGVLLVLALPAIGAAVGGAIGGTFGSAFASVLAGGAAGGVIAGGGVAALGAALAVGVQSLAYGLALAGVASLLAGPDGPDGGGEKSSSLSQTDNIVGQGMPIPIGYGRMMLGSFVISATSTSSYTEVSNAWSYEDTVTNTHKDKHMNNGREIDVAGGTVKSDGYVIPTTTYDGGYSETQLLNIVAVNEANLGGGTYEVRNHTTANGTTIATPIFKPVRIAGSYTGDAAINHR